MQAFLTRLYTASIISILEEELRGPPRAGAFRLWQGGRTRRCDKRCANSPAISYPGVPAEAGLNACLGSGILPGKPDPPEAGTPESAVAMLPLPIAASRLEEL